jgi:hypothetical protein
VAVFVLAQNNKTQQKKETTTAVSSDYIDSVLEVKRIERMKNKLM